MEWAPDSRQSYEQAEGHFAVRLRYEDGTVWVDPQPDQPTDPADNGGNTGGKPGSGAAEAESTLNARTTGTPATGDWAALLPWVALLAASSLGLAGMGHRAFHHRKGS